VGDGTTSVVILAAELLRRANDLVGWGGTVGPRRGLWTARLAGLGWGAGRGLTYRSSASAQGMHG